jgi:hypothetical protein
VNHPVDNTLINHNLLIFNILFALICVHSRLKTLILTALRRDAKIEEKALNPNGHSSEFFLACHSM